MHKIHFIRENKIADVPDGSNLLDVWRSTGLVPDAPCGGRGTCGKCLVRILGEEERVVKACETVVHSDLEVDTEHTQERHQILTDGVTRSVEYDPVIRKRCAEAVRQMESGDCGIRASEESVPESTAQSAWAVCSGNRGIQVSEESIQKSTARLVWTVCSGDRVLRTSADEPQVYMAAVDIGTTTVAAYLLNGEDGSVCTSASCRNPQTQYGADVINRANYCLEHGMDEVTACIREAVNKLLTEMAEKENISVQDIYALCVVGNTCMHHMFLGISTESLTQAPYEPAVRDAMVRSGDECGITMNPAGEVWILPNIAGFVGADTVGCLIATDLAKEKEWTLMVDIGTNGELVLAKDGRLLTCSTAAGPAFEGAGISCGMRGADGAISHVKWCDGTASEQKEEITAKCRISETKYTKEKGSAETESEERDVDCTGIGCETREAGSVEFGMSQWKCEVIGSGKPIGICGSGILDLAAELLRSGQMDETGYLEEEIVLVSAEESGNGRAIEFTQKDVRQLQLAKAAIAAGIRLLAVKAGIELEEIRQVLIAGAFGSFMRPESACAIGLIPQELEGKIQTIGNAAGEGAKLVLRNRGLWEEAKELAAKAEFVELASMKEFMDCYVDEMNFPEE